MTTTGGNRPLAHQFPAPGRQLYPWLVHGGRRQYQTFCRISSSGSGPVYSECKNIPELRNKIVMNCSPDGRWLLLLHLPDTETVTESTRHVSIWSPTTQDSIGLPCVRVPDLQDTTIHQGFLSSSPTDPNCLILLFPREIPLILYCRVGDQKWSEFNYAQNIEAQTGTPLPQGYYLLHPVSLNGKIYATATCYTDLVMINVDDLNNCDTYLIRPTNPVRPLRGACITARRSFLLSWGDHDLYLIIMSANSFDFKYEGAALLEVYKFDFSTNSWEEVTSLNGGAIFLGSCYSLSCQPPAHDDSNNNWSHIYFTGWHDQTLFSYRVEDEKITSYLPCPKNLPQAWLSYWIMPALAVNAEDIHDHNSVSTYAANHHLEQPCKQDVHVHDCSSEVDPSKNQKRKSMSDSRKNERSTRRMMILENGSGMVAKDGESSLCDLSKEVLGLIAGNLSFVDYIHFRCVNGVCAASTIRMRTNPFPPCLIYRDRVNGVYNIIDGNLNQKLSVKIPEVLKDYKIVCSRDGWLLLEKYESSFAFFNPLTMQVVPTAPSTRTGFGLSNFTFLGKPSSSDCLVLAMSLFSSKNASRIVKRTAEPGTAGWCTFVVGEENQPLFIQDCNSPVFLRESCYYLGINGSLARLQLTKDGAFVWEVPDLRCPCLEFTRNYLTKCGGELVSIFMGDEGKRSWVRVFKLNHQKWEEIDSLEGYSLYLSWSSSVSYLADRPDMANRIYFPRFYKDGLVYYSLNTKKYHSMGNQHKVQNFYHTSMYLDCAWIEPGWS